MAMVRAGRTSPQPARFKQAGPERKRRMTLAPGFFASRCKARRAAEKSPGAVIAGQKSRREPLPAQIRLELGRAAGPKEETFGERAPEVRERPYGPGIACVANIDAAQGERGEAPVSRGRGLGAPAERRSKRQGFAKIRAGVSAFRSVQGVGRKRSLLGAGTFIEGPRASAG